MLFRLVNVVVILCEAANTAAFSRAGLMETANIINRMKPRAQGEWVNYTRTDRCEGVSSVRTSSKTARELLVLGRHWKVTVRSRFSSQRPTKNREETPRSSFYFFCLSLASHGRHSSAAKTPCLVCCRRRLFKG